MLINSERLLHFLTIGRARLTELSGTLWGSKSYVGGLTPEERPYLERSADGVELILKQDFQTAMNRYNPLQICEVL